MPALYSPVTFPQIDMDGETYIHLHQETHGSSRGSSIGRPSASRENYEITLEDEIYARDKIRHLRRSGFLDSDPVDLQLWSKHLHEPITEIEIS